MVYLMGWASREGEGEGEGRIEGMVYFMEGGGSHGRSWILGGRGRNEVYNGEDRKEGAWQGLQREVVSEGGVIKVG